MGFMSKLKFWKKDQALKYETLSEVGIKVLADEKFERRLDSYTDALEQLVKDNALAEGDLPLKRCQKHGIYLEGLYKLIKTVAVAFGSPGRSENSQYAQMVMFFEKLTHRVMADNNKIMQMLTTRSSIDQETLVQKWEYFLMVEIYPRLGMIWNQSFKDVLPSHAAVVIPPPQMPGFGFGGGTKVIDVGAEPGIILGRPTPKETD